MVRKDRTKTADMRRKKGFMKKFMKEFKEFALKGSMIDLAVGMIIGSAFISETGSD